MYKFTLACLSSLSSLSIVSAGSTRQLKYNAHGKFKFVQFTDLHYGDSDVTDAQTNNLVTEILEHEKPDFVVITGDVVSGYMWDGVTQGWTASVYSILMNHLTELGYNWAITAGNHDSQGDLTREQLSEFDRSFAMSLTQPNAANISHSFNYVLPIYDETGVEILNRLWFLDTGDWGCEGVSGYDCVYPD